MAHSSTRAMAFKQVDVFTATPFLGNPVAVVLDGDGLTTAQMQSIAAWTHLSETTFVGTPTQDDADYRLRIFTPRGELPFAGHPTLGSARALLDHGLQPKTPGRLMQECGKGLIAVRLSAGRLFFALPEPVFAPLGAVPLQAVAGFLGLAPHRILVSSVIDVGPVWLTLQLDSARTVLDLRPDLASLAALGGEPWAGVTVFGRHAAGGADAVEVRSFAPAHGVAEDPVCGSGNGCVAALIRRHRLLTGMSYSASQGQTLGRAGHVAVEYAPDGTIWIGGDAVTCVEGTIVDPRD